MPLIEVRTTPAGEVIIEATYAPLPKKLKPPRLEDTESKFPAVIVSLEMLKVLIPTLLRFTTNLLASEGLYYTPVNAPEVVEI